MQRASARNAASEQCGEREPSISRNVPQCKTLPNCYKRGCVRLRAAATCDYLLLLLLPLSSAISMTPTQDGLGGPLSLRLLLREFLC